MKVKKTTIVITIAGGLIGGTLGFAAFKRWQNKKLKEEIQRRLEGRVNATGLLDDFNDVFAGTSYINSVRQKFSAGNKDFAALNPTDVAKRVYELKTYILGAGTKEDEIIDTFKKLRDKVAVAQVSQVYKESTQNNLLDDLKGDLSEYWLNKLREIVAPMPAFRTIKKK